MAIGYDPEAERASIDLQPTRVAQDFADVIRALKAGKHAARSEWRGPYIYLEDFTNIPQWRSSYAPAICIFTTERPAGKMYGWTPSQADLLANDWRIW